MRTIVRRLRRIVLAVTWALTHPTRIAKERTWLRQQFYPRPQEGPHGGGLLYLGPPFLEAEGVPIVDPQPVPVAEADFMREDDLVLGVEMQGESRAYPWWIMDNSHVANDVLSGVPLGLMFCEICGTGVHFDPVVDEERLLFRVRAIYNGSNAFEDDRTGSLWSPYLAMAIRGPLRGRELTLRPLAQMPWGRWRDLHPETTVLPADLGDRGGHGSEDTMLHTEIPPMFRNTMGTWAERLPFDTVVLGMLGEGWQRVVPLKPLRGAGGVANLSVDETPLLALADVGPGSFGAAAYEREVDGRTLTFRSHEGAVIDEQTGSIWIPGGRCVEGPLTGAQLRYVPSHVSKWFIWATHFPGIGIESVS
jgi:hypothetical protein